MVNLNYNNYFPGGVCMHFSWKTILFLCLGTVLIGQTALGNIIPIDQGGLEGVVSDSITQVPIPEVRVELFASSPDWRIVIISPVAETLTDQNGFYKFENLPALYYLARYSKDGYENVLEKIQIQPNLIINLNVPLVPAGAPTPTPTPQPKSLLHGCVVQYVGILAVVPEPVPDAHIMVFKSWMTPAGRTSIEPAPPLFCEAYTNEEGLYEIPEIPYGSYHILAETEGYYAEKALIEIRESDVERNFELKKKLPPPPTPTPPPQAFGEVFGIVAGLNEDGETTHPLAGAVIEVFNALLDCGGETQCITPPVLRAVTDENGFYDIPGIPGGLWQMVARAEGYVPGVQDVDIIPDEKTEKNFILKYMSAPPPPPTGSVIKGRVFEKCVLTPPLKPIAGALVSLYPLLYQSQWKDPNAVASAVTDEFGQYQIPDIPPGSYVAVAEAAGFQRCMRNVFIPSGVSVCLNFLLIPLGAAPPDPGKTIVFENTFDEADENWKPAGAPDSFLMPQNIHIQGALQLSCSDNLNTFGYWYSPSDAVPLNENVIYKASYAISSDITDLTKVPCIRIRFNSQSEQIADMMVINSRGDAAVCPGPAGRIYTLYFTLPSQEIHLPENENDIYVSFDMVNMDKDDAQNALVSLDWIKIEALSKALLPQGTEIASLDFTQGSHGWVNQFAEDVFSAPTPLSAPESGGLALKSVNNTRTYGVWISPLRFIPMQGNAIYAIRWSLFSDQLETSSVPGIRLRASDEQNRLITQKCIFSNAEGDNSPTAAGGEYTMYYAAPPELDGAGLTLAFDIVNFEKSDAPEGTIGARSVSVWAIPAEQMP